jgi:asparagine synthase (glutamine-hydrolysing)
MVYGLVHTRQKAQLSEIIAMCGNGSGDTRAMDEPVAPAHAFGDAGPRTPFTRVGPGVHEKAAWGEGWRMGDLILQWDGEIYNRNALRRILQQPPGLPEPMLLLMGLEGEGNSFLQRINGPFAMAILDLERGVWTLARGAHGLKPIFWFESSEGIVYARDLPTLFRCPWVPREPNWDRIPEYLVFQHTAGGETLYRGVHELLPGQVIQGNMSNGTRSLSRLPVPPRDPLSNAGVVDESEARNRLWGAVATLVAHSGQTPAALFLSGGVDSTLLAEALHGVSPARDIKAATVTSPGFKHDEAKFARTVREGLDIPGEEIPLRPDALAREWKETIHGLLLPLTSTNQVPWWLLCKWAWECGRTVAFSGEGADGWFSGGLYDDARQAISDLWDRAGEASRKAIFCRTHQLNDSNLVQNFCTIPLDVGARELLWDEARQETSGGSPDNAAVLYHVRTTGWRLLTRADLVASQHGVTLKLPFLEGHWLRWVISVPFQARNLGGVRKLPLKSLCSCRWGETFAHRKKVGFPFPIRTWIRDANARLLQEWRRMLLEPRTLRREIYRGKLLEQEVRLRLDEKARPADWLLWSLINIELWLRDLENNR